jgi:hypothetical protein
MTAKRKSNRPQTMDDAREEGLRRAIQSDQTRQGEHPLVELAEEPPPAWARWRVELWCVSVTNWRLYEYARDHDHCKRLGEQVRALGHRVRYKEMLDKEPPEPASLDRIQSLARFRALLHDETQQDRLLLPRTPWIGELGVALSKLMGSTAGKSPRDWQSHSHETSIRFQQRVCELVERAVSRKRVPSLSPKLWELIERLARSLS